MRITIPGGYGCGAGTSDGDALGSFRSQFSRLVRL